MIISNQVSIDYLVADKKYVIAMNWNQTNDMRFDPEGLINGTFKRLEFIKGRTMSYDTGLQILLRPSRINAIFEIAGQNYKVSSANTFYTIYQPTEQEICSEYSIRGLNLPPELKREIRKNI